MKVLDEKQPEIKNVFHKDIINALCSKNGPTLVAPNGRRRDFFDRINHHTENEAISFLPQCIVSDQTKFEGILKTAPLVDDYAYLLAEQHDGVLYECPRGKELDLARTYKKNVEVPIDFRSGTLMRDYLLVVPCEVSVGDDWYSMKEVKL